MCRNQKKNETFLAAGKAGGGEIKHIQKKGETRKQSNGECGFNCLNNVEPRGGGQKKR